MQIYLFGSWLRSPEGAEDIDVLVVYPPERFNAAHALAGSLRSIEPGLLYDVLALSEAEERELSFVANEGARKVWPA